MVSLVKHDLEFILKQIKIAEAHAAGGDLAALVAGYNGNDGLTQAHLLPYGLRTVDGSYNNLLPGRENWGASDQSFPGLFDPTYMNDADGDQYNFSPIPGQTAYYTNNDYANAGTRTGSQPGPGSGTVIDADPRIISNLIVDQTLNNPAAIAAALTHAGVSGPALMTALGQIVTAKQALDAALEAAEGAQGPIADLEADVAEAQTALAAAEAISATAAATAGADQAAFDAATADANAANAVRQAALNAYTALILDGTPDAAQTAEIQAAFAAFQDAQASYTGLQSVADGLGAVAGTSATAAAVAAADVIAAQTDLIAAETALTEAQTVNVAVTEAQAALDLALDTHGVEMDGNTVYLPNVSPDEGLSSPFNGWMTIFGQFFDHGLDLVAKGGNGTVYVPLSPDDPLYVPGGQNYIPLTRVTVDAGADGILGTADDGPGPKNLTTPWVDQNQTYASTASKQVFMREYIAGPDGKPIATGHLLEGSKGGLATWADIKAQARDVLGIELTDLNVGNIPLIAADEYGNFIPGANGYPQLVVGMGADETLGTADDVLREGNPEAPVSAQGVVLTGHAFLDDIAHAAVPIVTGGVLQADTDSALGYANADGSPGPQGQRGPAAYDNELLDRHFIAGDGRVNENIALTAVHHVFHSEHNRVVEMTKQIALDSGDLAFLNEWLLVDVTAMPTTAAELEALVWDGERLFQAGRFTNEMEYQHLVFEEFGRMMQPDIDVFLFEPSADINPSIAAEFAHVVYRFGHSMLRQDIAVIEMDENGNPVQRDISLFDGFLNPVMYDSLGDAEAASGAIIRGMSRQTGSEIDEFVTDVLRNQLLGIPLDLATINIARGRDVGTPPLNAARAKFFEATGDTLLKPYVSWADFALNLKNPASIINFIAAYGTHVSVLNTQAAPKTVEELREAATLLVLGGAGAPTDRLDFLNGTGAYANDPKLGGLNTVDFWMGGLAEKKMAFGGMLGSTFSFVFQMTMENLQDADRFYYLSRAQGLNLLNELENNSFAELVMRNTDLGDPGSTVLPGNLFSAFEMPTLEMDPSKQLGDDPLQDNPYLPFAEIVERRDAAGKLIDDDDTTTVAAYIRINSNEHFTVGGTEGNDTIISGGGDDAIWGRGGNDTIEAGYGVDKVFGGEGDDIITNAGTDIGEADFLHGNEGNDVIHGGSGLSLIFGNQGNDFLVAGPDGKTMFGGTGNDFILGGTGLDVLHGNEGDDWLEGGDRFDTLAGENSELFFNSTIIGHDVLNGGRGDTDYDAESGDDIMFVSVEGIQRMNGMAGFDWATHKGDSQGANSNLGIPIFESQEAFILRDRFDLVEGLSGWKHDDTLTGRLSSTNSRAELQNTAAIPGPDSPLDSYSNDLLAKNVALINGLAPLVAYLGAGIPVTRVVNGQTVAVLDENGVQERIIFNTADASDILLGGGGGDVITGLAGNDIIDGDNWLNVRIRFVEDGVAYTADSMEGLVYREVDYVNGAPVTGAVAQFGGRELDALMFDRTINPGQLSIVREIVDGDTDNSDEDIAVFTDVFANYTIIRNDDGSITVDHTGFDEDAVNPDDEETVQRPVSDGTDRLFNIEVLRFADGDVRFTPPELYLQQTTNTFSETFDSTSYTGDDGAWSDNWVETGDTGDSNTSPTGGGGTADNGQIRINQGRLEFDGGNTAGNSDGAVIQRGLAGLAGAQSATISYDFGENIDNGETVLIEFSRDGTNLQLVQTLASTGNIDIDGLVLTGPFTAEAFIRFTVSAMNIDNDVAWIDNLSIVANTGQIVNYETTFTEDGNEQAISRGPLIVEDSNRIVSARVVLTNAKAGDVLTAPTNLPGNITRTIDTSVAGLITMILTTTTAGGEDLATFQSAIQAIEFENTSQNPSTVDRIIQVTVSDGVSESNVAVTTVNVLAVDDPTNANNDTVITNVARGTAIVIPEWALLANDVDPDNTLDVTAVSSANGLNGLSLATNPGAVTVTDPTTGTSGGTFTYTATGGNNDNASVSISNDTAGNVDGNDNANILIGNAANSTFDGGGGNDIILAGAGNDTIIWNVGDGRDFVDGGTNTAAGDTFQVNGSNQAEDFVVYARAAADAAGIVGLKEATQIIVVRNGTVIAELAGIEELVIDTNGGNDNVTVVGDLTPTALFEQTITVNGSAGDDTVDISGLTSAHRILLRTNGGNDTIVGTLRPQDVVELPEGASAADYESTTDENGVTTMTNGSHTLTFTAPGGPPQFSDQHGGDDEDEDDDDNDHSQDGNDSCGDEDEDEDDGHSAPSASGPIIGTALDDLLKGTSGADLIFGLAGTDYIIAGAAADIIRADAGNDFVHGEAGRDIIFAGEGDDDLFGGDDADMIYGEAGNDRLFGEDGNDLLDGGLGNDTVFGGLGNDLIIAHIDDGNDTYDGGAGIDTLDYGSLTDDVTVNLGTGAYGRGSVTGSQSGIDTLYGIENITTGSGDDVIEASNAVNVIDGGDGNDTFVFGSAAAAHNDTIVGFEAGDKIDLSGIDANTGTSGVQSFTLITGQAATAPAQIAVTHEVREDGEYTVISGNTAGDNAPEFRISLTGNHTLTSNDFNF